MVNEVMSEPKVKPKAPPALHIPSVTAAAFADKSARWPDLTGGCAPEAGHLADSMPEADKSHDGGLLDAS